MALRLRYGDDKSIVLSSGQIFIGRSTECHVQVRDILASRRHAEITMSKAGAFVSDLGSRQLIVYNANNGVEKLRQPLPFGPTALSLNKAQRIAWLTGVGGELLGVSYP